MYDIMDLNNGKLICEGEELSSKQVKELEDTGWVQCIRLAETDIQGYLDIT